MFAPPLGHFAAMRWGSILLVCPVAVLEQSLTFPLHMRQHLVDVQLCVESFAAFKEDGLGQTIPGDLQPDHDCLRMLVASGSGSKGVRFCSGMGINSCVPPIGDRDRNEILFVGKHDFLQVDQSDSIRGPINASTLIVPLSLVLRSQQATFSANVVP